VNQPVSVVIGTRNHGDSIAVTLETILANDYRAFDVTVVDQSTNDQTQVSVAPFLRDPRVCYIRTPTRGLARGQNIGIAAARGELIAITDDDCRAPSSWVRNIVDAFEMDSQIGVVLGNVLAAPYDPRAGFTQCYIRAEPFLAHRVSEKHRVEGIGANMACRRRVWQALNGLDEMLGAGTPLYAAEETDFIIRALLLGYFVYETPNVFVTHHGFRTWDTGNSLIQGYICGLTAMYVKYLKCARWSALLPLLHQTWRWAFHKPAVDFGQVPSRRLRLRGFAQGLWKGLGTPVDRTKCLFKPRNLSNIQ
jgi:GT2 family glycosyltransferase